MTLWLDVEDLFHYAVRNPRPSGIQRLSFEIYAELHAMLGDEVRFCRHDPVGNTLRSVPWEVLRDLFASLLAPRLRTETPATPDALPDAPKRRGMRRLAAGLPLAMRDPLAQAFAAQRLALSAQRAVLRHGGRAVLALPSLFRAPPGTVGAPVEEGAPALPPGLDIRAAARPGDVLAVLGSPWFHPDYSRLVADATRDRGMRTALLVYDLIPLLRPEWCDRGLVRVFRAWFNDFAPRADVLLAISDATARDVERWADRAGIPLARPVHTLPIGTGFSGAVTTGAVTDGDAPLPDGLRPGGYALAVSTIEARKNHLLLFRVWRRMLEGMPPEQVPTLVFAGRVGWLVSDLMQQLSNCAFLDGKVVIVNDPTDEELVALYRGCRFTLFPSLYEGWGLPVTESLSFGKVCVASNRTSVPEAGGTFCLYLDPEDAGDAHDVIRRACLDDALIAEGERRIREEFRPTPWRETAAALLRSLGIPAPR